MRTYTKRNGTHRDTEAPAGARDGQILVLAAIGFIVMASIAMLAVDVGLIYVTRARLQNASDAGTIAAAVVLLEQRNAGAGEEQARQAAAAEAATIVAANWDQAGCTVAFGVFSNGAFTEAGTEVTATAVLVAADRGAGAPGGPLALFFAPLMGMDSIEVSTRAVADSTDGIRTIRNNANFAPFAVYEGNLVAPGDSMTIYDDNRIVPGNFGLLNLDGGSLGTPELIDWILNGYPGEVTIDPALGYVLIDGECGFRTTIRSAVELRIDKVLVVSVYDDVTGQGSNALFRVVRFIGMTITAVQLTGNNRYITASVNHSVNIPNGEAGGPPSENLYIVSLAK